jgi:hypothetical protein
MIFLLEFLAVVAAVLFLWQKFPAFKWVLAVSVTLSSLFTYLALAQPFKEKKVSKVESAPFVQLWEEKQELVIPPPHKLTPEEWAQKAERQQALDKSMGRTSF